MARHETRPDEPAPWTLLRELGPEFLEVSVRAQVAWHGPTAAWASALDLGVGTLEVTDALRGLRRAGEISAVLDTSARDRRWVLAARSADPGPLDLWAFTLGWLATRAFTDRYIVVCPRCSGLGYRDRSWLGTDLDLAAHEASPIVDAVHAVIVEDRWRITTRTWCSSCYGDDEGELGKLELTVPELPWGLWIAALISGSTTARQEHEAALAVAVNAVKLVEARAAARPSGLGSIGASARAVGAAIAAAAASFSEFNRALARVGRGLEGQAELRSLPDEVRPTEPTRRGPVGARLRRRLGRGRW